ncbi:uncharacterized protein [Aegilops tauschii subsp. strangulata]|uniref:uncharacterized protein n=1 Tax=Aegilops tauschii subsp. strangulata TaxID=200361 RepID=UPI00098B3980|nr:uncharacterized protein LOC109761145 [Aegilops tauschii subsp. strangulata]
MEIDSGAAHSGRDEIDDYIRCRYISSCEACWRMFAFDIHGQEPSVERLVVHMPEMNRAIFSEHDTLESVLNNPLACKTRLTEWFVANRDHPEARALTYGQFPSQWTWDGTNKVWHKRKRASKFGDKIGRVYNVHPGTGELFYLRHLLMHVAGATCFEDVRTYGGVVYDTFKEACFVRGLVGDDKEWFRLFDEAIVWATPYQLRHLFMTVLVFCEVNNGRALFDQYWESMVDDIVYDIQQRLPDFIVPQESLKHELLQELAALFARNGSALASFGLSPRVVSSAGLPFNRLITEEMQYDKSALGVLAQELRDKLNDDQRVVYNEIMCAINEGLPRHVKVMKLEINMRLMHPDLLAADVRECSEFADWVLSIGEGTVPAHAREGEDSACWITIPDDLVVGPSSSNIRAAIDSIYDDFFNKYSDPDYLAERTIVCLTNAAVDEINDVIFESVPGNASTYYSGDTVSESTDFVFDVDLLYPREFLHSIDYNNFPQHILNLKVRAYTRLFGGYPCGLMVVHAYSYTVHMDLCM